MTRFLVECLREAAIGGIQGAIAGVVLTCGAFGAVVLWHLFVR
jgi:hypothetical protein